jgi:hypothetical protein
MVDVVRSVTSFITDLQARAMERCIKLCILSYTAYGQGSHTSNIIHVMSVPHIQATKTKRTTPKFLSRSPNIADLAV